MTNGRQKGSRAEREVAQLCEAWWCRLEPACQFVRTPMSGGWHGPTVREHFKTGGDLMTTAKRWPFSVEIKRREAWSLERVLAFKASPAWGWWAQCCRASREDKRAPMMWMRQSRGPWYVVLPGQWERSLARVLARSDVLGFAHDVVVAHAADLLALDPAVVVRAAKRFAALP